MNDARESNQAALLFYHMIISILFFFKSLTLYKQMIPIPRIRLTTHFLYYLLPFKVNSFQKRNDTGLQYYFSIAYV